MNSIVNEQVKKILKKQKKKKKKHKVNALDEFTSLSVSEDSSNNDSSSDDTNIYMDSSDDAWSVGSDETFRNRNKIIKLGKDNFTHLDDCINANYNYESVRSHLASHPKNQSDNDDQHVDLASIVFGLI